MPYYLQGDYYPGRRYQGDLWGSIKKIGGTILKTAGGFAGGGVVGGVATLLPVLTQGQGKPKPSPSGLPAPTSSGGGINLPGPWRINPLDMLPGGKPGITREGGACAPGWHLDKKTGSYCVRNRQMNPANPRALRRAIRREKKFVALARRTLAGTGITIGRKPSFAKKKVRR